MTGGSVKRHVKMTMQVVHRVKKDHGSKDNIQFVKIYKKKNAQVSQNLGNSSKCMKSSERPVYQGELTISHLPQESIPLLKSPR